MNGEETTLQDSQPRPRKLTLTRETLRSLGDATLERAAGGTFEEPRGSEYGCDPFMTSASPI
jgi:hypothetical protein